MTREEIYAELNLPNIAFLRVWQAASYAVMEQTRWEKNPDTRTPEKRQEHFLEDVARLAAGLPMWCTPNGIESNDHYPGQKMLANGECPITRGTIPVLEILEDRRNWDG